MKVVSDTQSSNRIVDIIKQLIIYLFLFDYIIQREQELSG